ncbi:MAG: hypothetical protein EPN92_13915, partial [Chitinophagaceae bacterium]
MKAFQNKLQSLISKIFALCSLVLIAFIFSFMGTTQDDWEAPKEAKMKKNPVVADQVAVTEGK